MKNVVYSVLVIGLLTSCSNYFKDDYTDNSPTSGKLKVYCDEGLIEHIENQALTFESQYSNAEIEVISRSETEAIEAFYNDSCKAIAISRELTPKEKGVFKSKDLDPQFSHVAYSGVALITNSNTNVSKLEMVQLQQLLTQPFVCVDSINSNCKVSVVFESNKSSVVNYLKDSVIKGKPFSQNCSALKNSLEVINYVANHPNIIGFIDFAWLSDKDDSLYKAFAGKIKFIPIGRGNGSYFEPNQTSFKTGEYPLTRKVYIFRRTDDFSLAKGFESFVAGPKGQTIFLKQGLLPSKQQERNVQIKVE